MSGPAAPSALLLGLLLGPRPDVPADSLPARLDPRAPRGLVEDGASSSTDVPDERWAALGRRLFFDPLLSRDHGVACASCHRPDSGFADPRPLSSGVGGQSTVHHTPTLFNRALGRAFRWDGRTASLEEQVLLPIEDAREMGLDLDEALARLAADEGYAASFRALAGGAPDRAALARALASFVRCLWIGDSPLDRFRAGDVARLDPAETAGLWLYESRGGCWRCHGGANFSDELFHNTGVGGADGSLPEGRFAVTADPSDRGAFKTPTLRGLAFTAPYMHDGSLATLREVVEHYRRGGHPNPALSPLVRPLELSDADVDHLVAFLQCLSESAGDADPPAGGASSSEAGGEDRGRDPPPLSPHPSDP